ncbi:hypothetical protein RD110_14340 [Rhodoferax koreense]|uniref:Peptidase S8/S53 domain-containing protein n=1 Tax=Rhodoferax koreensis TaxID=1842727 RepID=A0A1P8JWV1_9BURK|nr:S8 family serine peptidase [Rhodoferax koreense]APW38232.1 hypothetical protein RD110_14340 [Rhodoferax koreense]
MDASPPLSPAPAVAPVALESADAAAELRDAFDPATGHWAFPQAGDFWDAVRAAHARGQRGAGARMAIVDTACDLGIPLLARASGGRAVLASAPGEPTAHGTAVALLVATVAPEAALDLYEITQDGQPSLARIAEALAQIAASEASIVCMSLGMPQDYNLDAATAWVHAHAGSRGLPGVLDAVVARPGWPKHQITACRAEVCLCRAVDGLRPSGKRVLAAVGNSPGQAFCPASAAGAIAVGFQLDRRERVALHEAAWSAAPDYAQSQLTDATLMQPAGVLGSSFATPLLAGALALGIGAGNPDDDLRRLMASAQIGALADIDMAEWYSRPQGEDDARDAELEKRLAYTYAVAIQAHPHYPGLAPETLLGSAIFGASFIINAGLFFMGTGELELARQLLSWARAVVPGNCHAAANLGKTFYLMAQRSEDGQTMALAEAASGEYAAAIALRPRFEPYLQEKAKIDAFIRTDAVR